MLIKYILFLGLFCYLITNSLAQAPLSGPVAGTLTKANSPYLITGSITIPTGQTLTIESGVEIRSASPYDQIAVYGTLLAQGMVSDSIRFTGFANPAYGSSHGGQLNFASGSVNSVLSYVVIDQWADTYPYARGNRPAVNVSTGVSSLTISNSSIRNSKGRGITISSSGVSMSDCSVSYSGEVGISIDMVSISPVISSVAFSGNGNAIVAYASSVSGLSNLTNADIQLRGGPTETSCSIPKAGPGSYYNLAESGFSISANTVTTIEPGAEIRSPSATDQIVVNGTLLAQGTASDSIRFVGLANLPNGTTHGGRLIFANGSVNSVLSYVTIDHWAQTYQYGPNRAAIEVNSGVSALSISNSSIRNSQGRGMHISSSGVSVSNCRVSNNGTIGINIDVVSISPVINSVVFSGNGNAMMAFASSVGGLSNLTNADIQLRGGSTETSCSIPKAGPGSYYNLLESGFSVSANTITSIQPGAEIRSPSATDQIVVNGTLLAQGTASDSIRFVGLANLPNGTTHGGRLIFANGSVNSVLSYVAIDHWAQTYQYGPNRAAIEVNPGVSSLSISNSSIRNSQGRGMHISSSGVSVSNCTISNNGTIGINIDTPLINPVINSVVFSGNGNAMMAFVSSVGGLSNLTNADIQLRGGATETSCTIPKPGSGSYYNLLESGFSISANTVTSIQPGVEIRSSYANDQITINGTLLAQGTTSDSIRFTGFANPFFGTTYGGRFNFTSGSSNSVLSYVAIDRWGETDQYGSMWTIISNTGSMSVINSSIRNSKRVAIRIEPVSISPVISGVSFANNGNAILVPVSSVGGFSNLINADVQLRGGATETSCTIPKPGPGSYYNLLESGFSVSANTVTTIEPGAEIRSASPYDQIVVNGTLLAQGTASDSIRFTGFANPAYGSSHGGRINFVSGSGNSVLSYAVIDSWGETYQYGSATGAIVSNTSSLSISKATIRNSKINGIYNSSSPIIATSTIYGNSTGIFNLAGQPVLQNNKIFSNTNYGINNVSSDTVDARNTYWGASNGPFHPTLNPNGNGNKVSDRVKFIPWLEQVGQADQTINLPEILDKYVDETVVLNATATSNLPVSFSINTVPAADVASITSNTITFPGTIGQVTVTASQAGNDYFKPATLQRTFNVLKRNQSISVATIPTKTFGDEPFSLTAIATSGLPVTFSVVSGPATISGDLLTLTGAGSVVVEASQIGDRVYNLAIASTTFTVVSANPVVQASISPSSATLTCASPTVSLIASGGLSYRWEDGSENAERSVSTAGVYAVTVTSSSGSTATTSISVGADQTAPFLSINPSAATLTCASPIVSLTAVGVGSLRWDDNTTNAIQIVSVAGTYSVTLTGSNGCTATSSVMVDSDQTAPSVSINPSSVTLTCATPSVSLTAAGNGSVRWDNNDTNAIRTVSAPGTYSVTLTSPGGCTATASVQVSSDQTAPAVSITASCTTLTCANPTATLTVLGAGSVLWSTNSTQSQISVSSAGTYSVTLAAPSGCTASASVTINADQTAPAVSINPSIETPAGTTLTCASPSVSLTAVGVGTYRWNTGATSQIISATSVGTYSVTLTGANGCSSSTSIQVFQDNSVPTVSIISSSTTLTCASPSISLTAVGNGSVHWENGSTNAIRTVSTAGTYSLTLTGSNGCTASASVSIVANQVVPTVNLTNNGPITCTQTNVTLTASGGDVYQFSAGATQSGGDGSKATVSQQGVYSVTALSANGCSAIASTTVSSNTVIAAPTLQASATTTTNQPISVTASGCSGTLTWQTQGGTGTASGAVYTFTQPGSYILSATCQLVSCTSPAASLTLVIQATAATLSVSYQNADLNQPTNNAIKPNLQLNNEGSTPIPYGEITVRYWLTAENFAPMTNLSIYWAQLGTDKVKLKYVEIAQPRQGAFGYLEYSFLSSAGNLAPNSNSGPIQTGVGKQDWTNFNEADDYSFANNNSYVKSSKVTAYRNGVLIWGIEPSVVAPQQQLKILTQNQSSATTNSISTYLQLSNEGNVGVNYSDLKVRYYFTSEGTLPLNFYLDYAVLGNSNVKGTFVKVNPPLANADTYLELSFMNLSKLYPLSGTGNIQYRIAKSDWTNFTQTNDYSYQSANSFVENSRVVVYLAGLRVYGIEPGATSREAAPEPSTGLSVKLLGNPMESNQLEVAISGVEGQAVELKMYNQQGHPLTYQRIDQSAAHQRVQLVVESPPGVLLLQVRTAMASQSIRVVKIR